MRRHYWLSFHTWYLSADLIVWKQQTGWPQANRVPMDAPERLDAGLLYTLKLAESSGHLSMHKERFVQRAVNLLRTPTVTWKAVAQRAFEMLKDNRLAIYRDHIYRPIIAQAENDVAVQGLRDAVPGQIALYGRPG